MPLLRESYSIVEELCSIKNIFGYKIEPDIDKIDMIENEISILMSIMKTFSGDNDRFVKLKLNIKVSECYPYDIPEIMVLNIDGLNEQNIREISNLIHQLSIFMCGSLMLTDILIKIEDYVRENVCDFENSENVIKTIDESNNEESSSSICSKNNDEEINNDLIFNNSIKNCELYCFDEIVGNFSRLNLIQNLSNNNCIKFDISKCAFHHCGVCNVSGVRCCSNESVAYNFRVWNFSMKNVKKNDNNTEYMRRSLINIAEIINTCKKISHNNIYINPNAFIYDFNNELYFLLGYPLQCNEKIPLCMYLEGLMVKASERTMHSIIKQILSGLNYLHKNSIVHGSLYTCNIFIGSDLNVCIRDCYEIDKLWDLWKNVHTINGSVKKYIELHHFSKFSNFLKPTYSGDVFYLGLIILSLCECKIYNTLPITIPAIFNNKFEDFISCCVGYTENCRSSTDKLLKHSFISSYRPTDSIWIGSNNDCSELGSMSKCKRSDSRLLHEFELIKVIGKGAFGVVVLAKNRIDSCIYAVKRIILKSNDPDERNRIVREVQIMSRLNHPNIVRYFNAWVEYQNIDWFVENVDHKKGSLYGQSIDNDDQEYTNDNNSVDNSIDESNNCVDNSIVKNNNSADNSIDKNNNSVDNSIVKDKSNTNKNNINEDVNNSNTINSSYIVFEDDSNNDISESTNKSNLSELLSPISTSIYVYMQMEYCDKRSLKELIESGTLYSNDTLLWQLFRDITSGLAYIHSQGMIHRDIKPENILVSSINHAKIVDFNLAAIRLSCQPNVKEKIEITHNDQEFFNDSSVSRVGTYPYTAPEIESLDTFLSLSPSIDMYSFGIVFFEMCHSPFLTRTERYIVIKKLKSNKIIDEITDLNKINIILSLIHDNPSDRSSADALLTSSVYPLPVEEININKVAQHVLSEPWSIHSKKLLHTFFTHSQNTDIKESYLEQFHFSDPHLLMTKTLARKCIFRFIDCFLRKRGCIDMLCPTFHPYHDNNVYSKLSSLAFIDSYGTKLCLNTHFISHLFEVLNQISREDIYTLPITKFGGVHHAFLPDNESNIVHHPYIEFEYYYALICTSNKSLIFINECICETFTLLNNFLLSHYSLQSPINPSPYFSSTSLDFSVFIYSSVQISINHVQFLLLLLRMIELESDEIVWILNLLSSTNRMDNLANLIEAYCNDKKMVTSKRSAIISILTFRGYVSQLPSLLFGCLKLKHCEELTKFIECMKMLINMIKSRLLNDIVDIVVDLSLYFNNIWSSDDILFKIDGKRDNQMNEINLACGGLFRYNLKNVKFWDDILLDTSKYHVIHTEGICNNDPSKDDIKIVYSSVTCKLLFELISVLHSNKTCICNNHEVHHDTLVVCYEDVSDDQVDFLKLHLMADILRSPPHNFSVYVYDHVLTYDCIRNMRDRLVSLNVSAVVCFKVYDSSARVFLISSENHDEIFVENVAHAVDVVKYLVDKSLQVKKPSCEKVVSKLIIPSSCKNKEIIYLNIDEYMHSSLLKKHMSTSRNLTVRYDNVFNNIVKYVIVMAELTLYEFSSILTEYDFLELTNFEVPLTTNKNKSSCNRVYSVLQLIRDNSHFKSPDTVFFLYNIKTNQLKPLF